MRCRTISVAVLVAALGASSSLAEGDQADLGVEVAAVERAFAQTMADRDHEAFVSFLSDEAIFISGPTVLRGKAAVAEQWLLYFQGPQAPFSWEPEMVEVLESGTLALSSGPVRGADGNLVATYTSIWRQEEPGVWRIVLDKGNPACPPPAAAPRDAPVASPESALPDEPAPPAPPAGSGGASTPTDTDSGSSWRRRTGRR